MYNRSEICRKANEFIKEGYTKSEAFKKAWAMVKEKTAEEMTLAEKARAFKEIQRQMEELQGQAEAIKKSIIEDMGDNEEIKADIFKIKYITVISNRLDTGRLKKENNDLYKAYLKASESKRFTVVA